MIMAVSVPKRIFKRAVDRNLLKRRIREAYRLNKPAFYELMAREKKRSLHLVIQYQHRKIVDYHNIEDGLIRGLAKIEVQLRENKSV